MRSVLARATRALVISAALAAMLAAALPGVSLAAPSTTFGMEDYGLTVGSECIFGRATPNATLNVAWRDSAGALKLQTTTSASEFGGWQVCRPEGAGGLVVGDRLRVSDGSSVRRFTMPRVTVGVDRVADVFRGRAPANSSLVLYYHAGIYADYQERAETTSDAEGRWRVEGVEILGGIDASIEWIGPNGDYVDAFGLAPFVMVTIGESMFSGGVDSQQESKFYLRNGTTDALRAVGAVPAGDDDYFAATFRNTEGDPVNVRVGDRIRAKAIAADFNWLVPNISATTNVATDRVSGACGNPARLLGLAELRVRRGPDRDTIGFAITNLESDGSFSVRFAGQANPFFDPADIKSGDKIDVRCLIDTADTVARFFSVP